MIGSFPIGTFPYGRAESEAGIVLVVLGVGQATASANDVTLDILFRLQADPAEATAQGVGSNIGIGLGAADAQVSGLQAATKVLLDLGLASSEAQALDLFASSGVRTIPAQASAQAFDFSLSITVGTEVAEAIAQGQQLSPKTLLALGLAQSETEANDLITKTLLQTIFATAVASGQVPVPLIRFKIGRASADAQAQDASGKFNLELGTGEAVSEALDISGLGIAVLPASAIANAQDFLPKTFLDTETGQAQADVNVIIPLAKLDMGVAEAIANGQDVSGLALGLPIAPAIAEALDADAVFIVRQVPNIIVTRSGDLTQNVLKVLNDTGFNINIYRADDHRGLFTKVAENQSSPYTDSGLDVEKNFKYKATFVVDQNGNVVAEGGKSEPRYTIGNNKL